MSRRTTSGITGLLREGHGGGRVQWPLFWPYNDAQYRRLLRVTDGYFKGIWSLLKRSMANFAVGPGLKIEPW